MTNIESLPHELMREGSYKLLSECYYLPNEELINMLNNLGRLNKGQVYLEIAKCTPSPSELESLIIDFSKLFIGPFKLLAPPYGSVYMEAMAGVMGNTAIEVRDSYRSEGVDICLKEPPDYIAIELEFMYLLILKEIEALENHDYDAANNYLRKQKSFLEKHLAIWVSEFTGKIEANTKTQFYKNLARITRKFIETDFNNLLNRGCNFTKQDSQ